MAIKVHRNLGKALSAKLECPAYTEKQVVTDADPKVEEALIALRLASPVDVPLKGISPAAATAIKGEDKDAKDKK